MALIELSNLSYQHAKSAAPVFERLNLRFEAGSTTAVMGPSGSGKSTLLSVIAGLRRPTIGSYLYNGTDISNISDQALAQFRGEQIGFIFQDFKLIPHLTILENVLLPIEHLRAADICWRTRANGLLEEIGLLDMGKRLPRQLSGGQAQRVAIARALIRKPKLLLADEPTGSLDDQSAAQILHILRKQADSGSTVVTVTHSKEIAQAHERTLVLENQSIVER